VGYNQTEKVGVSRASHEESAVAKVNAEVDTDYDIFSGDHAREAQI
jgi:hypothetical protein